MHLAGKSTLKDWKRAIRMNGIMLRWVLGGRCACGPGSRAPCSSLCLWVSQLRTAASCWLLRPHPVQCDTARLAGALLSHLDSGSYLEALVTFTVTCWQCVSVCTGRTSHAAFPTALYSCLFLRTCMCRAPRSPVAASLIASQARECGRRAHFSLVCGAIVWPVVRTLSFLAQLVSLQGSYPLAVSCH